MEKQDLMTILIQTGFNLERMFQDKAIKKEAYTVLKYRNDLAIAELKTREAETTNESSGLHKHFVNGSASRNQLIQQLLKKLYEDTDNDEKLEYHSKIACGYGIVTLDIKVE